MPTFRYRYSDPDGKPHDGLMMSTDEEALRSKLTKSGYWILEIEEVHASETTKKGGFKQKVKQREVIDFCFQLKTQVAAGIPLVDAIKALMDEATNPHFAQALRQIHKDLLGGYEFHETLSRFPKIFSGEVVCLIEAGVKSGALPRALEEARNHLEWAERLVAQVRQASVYPLFVMGAIGIFILTVFTGVVPKFVTLFAKINIEPPGITQMVFGTSKALTTTWMVWAPLLVFSPALLKLALSRNEAFAQRLDSWKLKAPVFGELLSMIALSRFSHNLSSLLNAGIPIVRCIQLCQGLVGNRVFAKALSEVEKDLEKGHGLSESLERHSVFNSLVIRMTKIGEKTGQIDVALDNIADYYDEIVPRQVKNIFSILEPALILFLVGIVGTIALAIFLPIFDLMSLGR